MVLQNSGTGNQFPGAQSCNTEWLRDLPLHSEIITETGSVIILNSPAPYEDCLLCVQIDPTTFSQVPVRGDSLHILREMMTDIFEKSI
jgi:hypothetical protein